jgi:heme exporter protein C
MVPLDSVAGGVLHNFRHGRIRAVRLRDRGIMQKAICMSNKTRFCNPRGSSAPISLSAGDRQAIPTAEKVRAITVTLLTSLLPATFLAIFFLTPAERTMGGVQRIMYVHISVAWLGLLGLVVAAGTGMLYLLRRDMEWDDWSHASAELGWLACSLTLVTGSLWASEAWGTWWTWDPRLTAAFVLWLIYSGYLMVRSSQEDVQRRARLAAVVSIVGVLDVPLVVLATRWFRGMHPVAPQMEPRMRAVLLLTAICFAIFFGTLLFLRRNQIRLERTVVALEQGLS